jgi:hypothetical protein
MRETVSVNASATIDASAAVLLERIADYPSVQRLIDGLDSVTASGTITSGSGARLAAVMKAALEPSAPRSKSPTATGPRASPGRRQVGRRRLSALISTRCRRQCPVQIDKLRRLEGDLILRQRTQKRGFGLRAEEPADEVGGLGNDELRDDKRL